MDGNSPEDELRGNVIPEWLPSERLPLDVAPLLYQRPDDRIKINVGAVVDNEQGEWIATLYVTDVEAERVHAVGWVLDENCWTVIGTWEGASYNLDQARSRSQEWVGEKYPNF